jgi:hypothetical protein
MILLTLRVKIYYHLVQTVSSRPLKAEARVRFRASQCGICGGLSSILIGFTPSSWDFPSQYKFTVAICTHDYHLEDEK